MENVADRREGEANGPTCTFTAGDSFVMEPGFVGGWRTIETVRKI